MAAVICDGHLLGLVPKRYLPNYNEFYEKRHFTEGCAEVEWVDAFGSPVPFGMRLLFCCRELPELVAAAELCEDLWAPNPPSVGHALAGATVLVNLSASDEATGKSAYRESLIAGQSARLLARVYLRKCRRRGVYAGPDFFRTQCHCGKPGMCLQSLIVLAQKAFTQNWIYDA